MKVQKDNDRRKGLVKCIGIIYICIIFYLTSIINNIRRFHYFLVALFRSVGVELVIPGLVEDIIGVVFNVWICTVWPKGSRGDERLRGLGPLFRRFGLVMEVYVKTKSKIDDDCLGFYYDNYGMYGTVSNY